MYHNDLSQMAIAITCIGIPGLVINGIALYVFTRRVVKTPSTYQFQWLAGADAVYLISRLMVLPIFTGPYEKIGSRRIQRAFEVYLAQPLEEISYGASISLTVFIALYRYFAICKPFSNSYRHVEKYGQKYVLLIVVMNIIYNISYICMNIVHYHNRTPLEDLVPLPDFLLKPRNVKINTDYPYIRRLHNLVWKQKSIMVLYEIVDITDLFPFPLLMLTFVTAKLIRTLRKRKMVRSGMQSSQTSNDNNIIVILTVILMTFLVCHLSVVIFKVHYIHAYLTAKVDERDDFFNFIQAFLPNKVSIPEDDNPLLHDAASVLTVVNSAANGFIYFLANKQFRSALIDHCRCRRNTQNQDIEMAPM